MLPSRASILVPSGELKHVGSKREPLDLAFSAAASIHTLVPKAFCFVADLPGSMLRSPPMITRTFPSSAAASNTSFRRRSFFILASLLVAAPGKPYTLIT